MMNGYAKRDVDQLNYGEKYNVFTHELPPTDCQASALQSKGSIR